MGMLGQGLEVRQRLVFCEARPKFVFEECMRTTGIIVRPEVRSRHPFCLLGSKPEFGQLWDYTSEELLHAVAAGLTRLKDKS